MNKTLTHSMKSYITIFLVGILVGCICRLTDYEKISSMTDSFMRQQLLDFLYALAARYAPVQYGSYPVHLQQDACRLPK